MNIISAAFMKNCSTYYCHMCHQIQNRISKWIFKKVLKV